MYYRWSVAIALNEVTNNSSNQNKLIFTHFLNLIDISCQAGGQRLKKVALLDEYDRTHFSLIGGQNGSLSQIGGQNGSESCQLAEGEHYLTKDTKGKSFEYTVSVQFTGGIYGSFSQWITFDFGQRPVLFKKLLVELGLRSMQEQVVRVRERLKFDRYVQFYITEPFLWFFWFFRMTSPI